MNKKDKVKLDVVSEIDDEIVEKVTVKRFLLSRRHSKRMVKWASVSAAAVLLLFAGILIPILLNQKHVPVYRGMTVSSSFSSAEVPFKGNIPRFDLLAADGTIGSQSGTPGASNRFDHVFDAPYPTRVANQDDPFGHGDKGQKFIEAASGAMQYTPSESKMYYAMPGEDVYINILFDNPDNYEILSFTLNGKKYSSYMFEEGSDMENLILKVNVGNVPGIVEYTIDAIKYVDGTDIKDVIIGGDRTVRVGVYTEEQPTATVADEYIGYDSLSLRVSAADLYDLISITGGRSAFVLYDGEEVVAIEELSTRGESDISLEELKPDTLYQYAVVAVYDNLKGAGTDVHVLYQNAFYTQPILSYDDLTLTQTGITFSFLWGEHYEGGVVESLDLYLGGVKVRSLHPDTREIGDLLSGTSYTLVATYSYKGNTETAALNFRTVAKEMPELTLVKGSPAKTSISFELNETDRDDIGEITKIELLHGEDEPVVAESTDVRMFENLLSGNTYTVRVTYSYDLNDGMGVQNHVQECEIKTAHKATPTFYVKKCISSGFSISFDIQMVDYDNVGSIIGVDLYKGESFVASSDTFESVKFDNLLLNTEYAIVVRYTADYNDGNGIVEKKYSETVKSADMAIIQGVRYWCDNDGTFSLDFDYENITDLVITCPEGYTIKEDSWPIPIIEEPYESVWKKLTSVEIHGNVIAVRGAAFIYCKTLERVSLPDSLRTIGNGAFHGCENLKEINIPKNVREIESSAFSGCKNLKEITLPEGMEKVSVGAFNNSGLETVYLPHSLKTIEIYAFDHTPLTDIHYNGTIDEWKAIVKGYEMVGITVTVHCTDGTYEQQP